MAYSVTAENPMAIPVVGSYLNAWRGTTTLSGGVGTVTIPGAVKLHQVFVSAQSTTACSVSETTGPSFSIAGGASDVIMWMAFGTAKR